jgi:hypothetical protein
MGMGLFPTAASDWLFLVPIKKVRAHFFEDCPSPSSTSSLPVPHSTGLAHNSRWSCWLCQPQQSHRLQSAEGVLFSPLQSIEISGGGVPLA